MISFFKKNKSILIVVVLIVFIILSLFAKSDSENISDIGVVKIEGTILNSEKIVKQLDDFNTNDNIKAIIVRLNTPGGAVSPSQEIYEKVKSISIENKKPIIASMGSVAASGGYYISIGADKIIANPGTITGSIGVIINFPTAEELVDKIGFRFNTIKSGKWKDAGSPYREVTEEEYIYFQDIVDDLYNQFLKEVSYRRNIDVDKLKTISNGQIFTGNRAYNLGLIDSIGTFEDALNISKNLANISGETNLVYPKDGKGNIIKMFFDQSKIWFNTMDNIPMYLFNN